MLTDSQRAYDHYVTVEQPGSWSQGFNDGRAGEGFDDSNVASESAYRDGYEQGVKEATDG